MAPVMLLLACVFSVTPAMAQAVESVPPLLMRAVVANESAFRQFAVSSAGAQGYAQLMPGTSRAEGVCSPFDRTQNIVGGTLYMRSLLDRFHGNVRLAVASYNAGPAAVERYSGVPPFAETQQYVSRVLGSYASYSAHPVSVSLPEPKPLATITPRPANRASAIGATSDPFRGRSW